MSALARVALALGLSAMLACSDGDDRPFDPIEPPVDPAVECAKAENVARAEALRAAQPALGARSKAILDATVTFPGEAGRPEVACPVALRFKDLNANGTVEPYEDWRRSPAERAADLLARLPSGERERLAQHVTTHDVPDGTTNVSAWLSGRLAQGVRFGRVAAEANGATPKARAIWANAVQEAAEASPLGIPFVLSMDPAHSTGSGRTAANGFSRWPHELGLAAANDPALVETFGAVVAEAYRAIGVRMALSPSADLFTDPRWAGGPFTFGEDPETVAGLVAAYVRGLQGDALGPASVAAVVTGFPGAGATRDGWDARLEKGRWVAHAGDSFDRHLVPFQAAIAAGAAGIMPGYGIVEGGDWTGLGGLVRRETLPQVGTSFSATLLGPVLREALGFEGLVVAPEGVVEDAGPPGPGTKLGAPWGHASSTRNERYAAALRAGVDQVLLAPDQVGDAPLLSLEDVSSASRRALELMFRLGLFEDPYVDAEQANARCGSDAARRAARDAMRRSLVLLSNAAKPAGFLNGSGDGTQVGDPYNAGNGSGRVLPAPLGSPYPLPLECNLFVLGRLDVGFLESIIDGFGCNLLNEVTQLWPPGGGAPIPLATDAERMARAHHVFVRVEAPYRADPDSGALALPDLSLGWASSGDEAELAGVAEARAAIDAAGSTGQVVVLVDGGRLPALADLAPYRPSAVYLGWGPTDLAFYDDAFGVVDGTGLLPVGVPLSDEAAAAQRPEVAGDGADPALARGFGVRTAKF